MRLLKNILIGVVGLVLAAALIGLFLDERVHVERSISIEAPPSVVFALVNDLRQFNRWSPWAETDPNIRYTFDGPASGEGARMSWESEHPNVSSGSSEIIESRPDRLVRTALDFGSQGDAVAFFSLEPVDSGTRVTWGFDSDFGYDLVGRYFGLLMDGWVGGDYERGLARLKRLAEGG